MQRAVRSEGDVQSHWGRQVIGRGHHGRVDRNQPEIVKALRQAGASVQSLAKVGDGCPDMLVGRGGVTYLIEVKDGEAPKSKQRLTDDQTTWLDGWRGDTLHIARSIAEALAIIGVK